MTEFRGGAQFVTHVGKELRFAAVGDFRGFEGLAQVFLRPFSLGDINEGALNGGLALPGYPPGPVFQPDRRSVLVNAFEFVGHRRIITP